VKYMLLIYNNADAIAALPDDERNALMAEAGAIMERLTASGELVGGAALAHPRQARTVLFRGGAPATTDGPFIESKEQFAGYVTVDVVSEARAVEIARNWPDARLGTGAMEVREVLDAPVDDD
jgi:hypothetical protein